MFQAAAAEDAQRRRDLQLPQQFFDLPIEAFDRIRPVGEVRTERARVHLLETYRQHDVRFAAEDGLARQIDRGGTAGAVIVDVDDGDARHADVVEHALAADRVAVDVAGEGLLDRFIAYACVGQCNARGLRAHFGVGIALARLLERNHSDTGNDDFLRHVFLLR
ncbi:hypothetical protein D3C81_1606970 [compost metagenome]